MVMVDQYVYSIEYNAYHIQLLWPLLVVGPERYELNSNVNLRSDHARHNHVNIRTKWEMMGIHKLIERHIISVDHRPFCVFAEK
jgi:hypothetical protein